jgi:DNA-directed RNA polymerase specialized sigma24 family protein
MEFIVEELNYNEIIQFAYRVSSNYLYDEDSIQEVAQITAIECFLNKGNVKQEALTSWLYSVAKNKSIDYIRTVKKQGNLGDKIIENDKLFKSDKFLERVELEQLIEKTPNIVVPIKHKELVKETLKNQYNFTKLAKKLKINKDSLRNKVYRIQQEILLYHKIINGIKRSEPIPGTKLHHNLLNFCQKLKKTIQNQDLSLFSEFEIDEHTFNMLLTLDMHKIIRYQFDIVKKNVYDLFIAYFEKNNSSNGIKFKIFLGDHTIKVWSPPRLPKKVMKINEEDLPEFLKEQLEQGSDGIPVISRVELDKKLKEYNVKLKVLYEKKEDK